MRSTATPLPPDGREYRCIVCAARWSYDEIRYAARCKRCDGALTRETRGTAPRRACSS